MAATHVFETQDLDPVIAEELEVVVQTFETSPPKGDPSTAADLGLENVNNTSDVNKPVSIAQQVALDLKVDKVTGKGLSSEDFTTIEKAFLALQSGVNTGDQDLSGKVDKVTGKGLSSEDFTTVEKAFLALQSGVNTGDQDLSGLVPKTTTVNGKALSGSITLSPTDVGAPAGSGSSTGNNTGDQDLSGYVLKGGSIGDITTRTHSLLTSLTADDHTQYLLLAGRGAEQTITGAVGINGGALSMSGIGNDILFGTTRPEFWTTDGQIWYKDYGFWGSTGSYGFDMAWNTYRAFGGTVHNLLNAGSQGFTNTCSLRLNNSGVLFYTDTDVANGYTPSLRMTIQPGGDVLFAKNIGIGSATSAIRNISSAITVTDASGTGILNTITLAGVLTAARSNYSGYFNVVNTADNTNFSNTLYGSRNSITNNNGYGYNSATAGYNLVTNNDNSKTNATSIGSFSRALNAGTGTLTNAYGVQGDVTNSTAGVISTAKGLYGSIVNTGLGSITNAYGTHGFVGQSTTAGNIGTAYAGFFSTSQAVGTITLAYGVYIATIAGGTTYGLYQADANNKNYFAGKVGIGLSAPLSSLGITGNASIGATYGAIVAPTSGLIVEGYVGIGTSNPTARLDIQADSVSYLISRVYNSNSGASAGSQLMFGNNSSATAAAIFLNSSGNTTFGGANSLNINNGFNAPITFGTQGVERVRITGTGNIGIGTVSPTMLLGLGGDTARNIGMERHTVSNTAGNTLTIKAGGATLAATDKNGGQLFLIPGLSTGTGESGVTVQGCIAGVTGTTDGTFQDMIKVLGNKLGFFNTTPVARAAHIADATDAATAITRINAILAVLENLGFVATA